MKDFSGRVAVVTGAASGIGQALAILLAQQGCDLALVDVASLHDVAKRCRSSGCVVSTHTVNVADQDAMRALPHTVIGEHGRIDILINNAGVTVGGTLEEQSIEDLEWLVGINVWGVVYGCKFFLPWLREQDEAYIVNLSSLLGLIGLAGQSSYCLSKFAVRGFSEALAAELADSSVRVMSVHPGAVATEIVRNMRVCASEQDLQQRSITLFDRFGMAPQRAAARILAGMRYARTRQRVCAESFALDWLARLSPTVAPRLFSRIQARLRR